MKLLAPAPGWTASADVIVVGSGIAALLLLCNAAHMVYLSYL